MSKTEVLGAGIAFISWSILVLVFNKPLSEFYKQVWPRKFGTAPGQSSWHRVELIAIAVLLLGVGVVLFIKGLF